MHPSDPKLLSVLLGCESHIASVLRHLADSSVLLGRGLQPRDTTGQNRSHIEPAAARRVHEVTADDLPDPIVRKIGAIARDAQTDTSSAAPHRFWHAEASEGDAHICYCARCGAYASAAPRRLSQGCLGAPPSQTCKSQLDRILNHKHPCGGKRYSHITLARHAPCMKEVLPAAPPQPRTNVRGLPSAIFSRRRSSPLRFVPLVSR